MEAAAGGGLPRRHLSSHVHLHRRPSSSQHRRRPQSQPPLIFLLAPPPSHMALNRALSLSARTEKDREHTSERRLRWSSFAAGNDRRNIRSTHILLLGLPGTRFCIQGVTVIISRCAGTYISPCAEAHQMRSIRLVSGHTTWILFFLHVWHILINHVPYFPPNFSLQINQFYLCAMDILLNRVQTVLNNLASVEAPPTYNFVATLSSDFK